jgi:hypothetical protein
MVLLPVTVFWRRRRFRMRILAYHTQELFVQAHSLNGALLKFLVSGHDSADGVVKEACEIVRVFFVASWSPSFVCNTSYAAASAYYTDTMRPFLVHGRLRALLQQLSAAMPSAGELLTVMKRAVPFWECCLSLYTVVGVYT